MEQPEVEKLSEESQKCLSYFKEGKDREGNLLLTHEDIKSSLATLCEVLHRNDSCFKLDMYIAVELIPHVALLIKLRNKEA